MNHFVSEWNHWGEIFEQYAGAMFWQVGLLAGVLLVMDWWFQRRVRAVVRHGFWMLLLLKLALPPTFSLPAGIGQWIGPPQTAIQMTPAVLLEQPLQASVSSIPIAAKEIIESSHPAPLPPSLPPTVSPTAPIATTSSPHFPAPFVPAKPLQLTQPGIILVIWILGVLAAAVYVGHRSRLAARWTAQAVEAPRELRALLATCQCEMKVRRSVAVKVSRDNLGPAVCGAWRPVILIPSNLLQSMDSEQMRAVLLHELAHVRRRDVWLHYAQTLFQVIHFYQPAIWLANSRIHQVREQAVDESVLAAMGHAAENYPSILVRVARIVSHSPRTAMGMVGILESGSALAARVEMMLERPFPTTARLGLLPGAAILLAGLILLPMARGLQEDNVISQYNRPKNFAPGLILAEAQSTAVKKPDITIKLSAVDAETLAPIAHAKITTLIMVTPGQIESSQKTTDDKGECLVAIYHKTYARAGISACADGYCIGNLKLTPTNLTNHITFKLERARVIQTLSGHLLLADGQPAARFSGAVFPATQLQIGLAGQQTGELAPSPWSHRKEITTDATGSFNYDANVNDGGVIFLSESGYARLARSNLTHKIDARIKPWSRVEGTLLIGAERGAKQKVVLWSGQFKQPDCLSFAYLAETDEEGRFHFEHVPAGWCAISRYYPNPTYLSFIGTSHSILLETRPGEVASVTLGGNGLTVRGNITSMGKNSEMDWTRDLHVLISLEEHPIPLQSSSPRTEFRSVVNPRLLPAALSEMQKDFTHPKFIFKVAADGSFQIDDVPPGTYRIIPNAACAKALSTIDAFQGASAQPILRYRLPNGDEVEDEDQEDAPPGQMTMRRPGYNPLTDGELHTTVPFDPANPDMVALKQRMGNNTRNDWVFLSPFESYLPSRHLPVTKLQVTNVIEVKAPNPAKASEPQDLGALTLISYPDK